MQKTGFALCLGLLLAMSSVASAQVILRGEVTTTTTTMVSQPHGPSVYVQTGPQPTRYVHHSEPIDGLIVGGGLGLFAGFLFTSLGELVLSDGHNSGCPGFDGCPNDLWYALTWIPVVGPWLGLGVGRGGDYEWINYVGGIVEDAGLILLVLGLVIHDEWDEPIYAFGEGRDAPALFLRSNGAVLTF